MKLNKKTNKFFDSLRHFTSWFFTNAKSSVLIGGRESNVHVVVVGASERNVVIQLFFRLFTKISLINIFINIDKYISLYFFHIFHLPINTSILVMSNISIKSKYLK